MSRFDDGRGGRDQQEPARSDQDSSWRKSGGSTSSGGSGGYRGGGGGYGNRDGGGGGNWRNAAAGGGGGGRFESASSGQRPRLNLKPRTVDGAGGTAPASSSASSNAAADNKDDRPRREPPAVNSRAAAFGSAPEYRHSDLRPREGQGRPDRGPPINRGPPPVANKRIAALADEEREQRSRERDAMPARGGGGGGGPEPAGNNRFAPPPSDRGPPPQSQGPPPVTNSRFAAAAAMAERDGGGEREREREPRQMGHGYGGGGGGGGRYNDRGPPPPQNSRFAAAAAADGDYGGGRGGDERRGPPRFGQRDGRDRDDRYSRDRDDQRRYHGTDRFNGPRDMNDRQPRSMDLPREPRSQMGQDSSSSRVDDFLKPKKTNILPAAGPSAEQEANMLALPVKARSRDNDEDLFAKPSKKVETKPPEPALVEEPVPTVSAEESRALLEEFASGKRKGEEFKAWVEQNKDSLPTIDQLILALLDEQEKISPDPNCAWAEDSNFGAGIKVLVEEDDVVAQMQVLWGIQFYCDKIGFPKKDDEYIVQAMFRSMYKYDLALDEAFADWKDDETEACEKGKLKAIIQTVEWFNWLAEADDDDEEDEDEEEGEEGEEELEE